MKIAIPVSNGLLSMHFGHCEQFALVDVDQANKKIVSTTTLDAPPHEPGRLPAWVKENGASMVIAGGMGQRAQDLFTEQGITVLTGAPAASPEQIVTDWLNQKLAQGTNICDH